MSVPDIWKEQRPSRNRQQQTNKRYAPWPRQRRAVERGGKGRVRGGNKGKECEQTDACHNTCLHDDVSSINPVNVCYWPQADIGVCAANVRSWGECVAKLF